jgi:hypothetical protein
VIRLLAVETSLGRKRWEPSPVLDAVETLLFDGARELAIAKKRC